MKYKFLKTLTLFLTVFSLVFTTGCLKKNDTTFVDFSTLEDFVVLTTGGYTYTTNTAFSRGKDTVSYTILVDLASKTNQSSPVTVTLGFNNAAITAYNAANGSSFTALPTSNYKIVNTTVTIPAGQHYAQTTLEIYTKGLDPSVNYMAAVSITDAGGKKLSTNMNTLYYSSIGNPLAGNYNWTYRRYQSADTSGAACCGNFTDKPVNIAPTNATTLLFPDSYTQTFINGTGGFLLSFTNNNGVFSNFRVSLDSKSIADAAASGFTLVTPPKLIHAKIVGNASTRYAGSSFSFFIQWSPAPGLLRSLVNTFVKQ